MSDPFSHFPSKTGKWKWLKTFARYWTSMFVDTVTITGLYWWKIACYCALFETCNRCSTRCSTASLKTPVLLQCSINVWLHTSFKCYKNSNASAGVVIEHSRWQSFEACSNTAPQRQQMLCSVCGPNTVTSSVHSAALAHWQFVVFRQLVEMLVHIRYKFGTHLKGISLPAVDTQQKM